MPGKRIMLVAAGCLLVFAAHTQDFGVSFSYFIPKNGYFSNPVTPFSIRGVGFDIGRHFAIETGGSLYRMAGMNVTGLPFESKEPLMGPLFSVLVPLEGVIQFYAGKSVFRIRGGIYGFVNFSNRVNAGNFDRAYAEAFGYELVNSNLDFENKPGWGYHFGGEWVIYLTDRFGLSFDVNYFIGDSKLALAGDITYSDGGAPITEQVSFPDSRMDFTGLELSVGVLITAGRSGRR